jgi:hypothetical protein
MVVVLFSFVNFVVEWDSRELLDYLVSGDRFVANHVGGNVHRASNTLKVAVNMSEKMQSAMVSVGPRKVGVVRQEKPVVVDFDFGNVHWNKPRKTAPVVVISTNQSDVDVLLEMCKKPIIASLIPSHVAEMPESISRLKHGVDVLKQNYVMIFDSVEGSIIILQDIFVSEVCVTNKESHKFVRFSM